DSSVETCTAFGSKFCRCTCCAVNSRSLNGSSNSASTSALVQSLRGSAAMRASTVSRGMADIRGWLAKRFARDAGASQTAPRAVNRRGGAVVYGVLERLLVESCPACGLASHGGFCGVCAAEFPRVANACPQCGLARPVAHCPRTQIAWDVDAIV